LSSQKQQEQIDWRRAKVLEMLSKGETNQSEEYQKCMTGMKLNLKQTLEIAETAADPKTKITSSSYCK